MRADNEARFMTQTTQSRAHARRKLEIEDMTGDSPHFRVLGAHMREFASFASLRH